MLDAFILLGTASFLFWSGYFTAAVLHMGKCADDDAQETFEH